MFHKILLLLILLCSSLLSKEFQEFSVASYNVENLFDLQNDGTEYREYKPYTKYWNKKAFQNKLKNISKAIVDLDADILALQEIESQNALKLLRQNVKIYKYSKFLKTPKSAIGVAILSKYPIISNKKIVVNKYDKYARYILKSTIKINNKKIIIYINHWSSKRSAENKRVVYATALKNELKSLDKNSDYIILGDLNSNYDEFQTFKYNKKLNNTYGITGINHILNTTINDNFVVKQNIRKFNKMVHYNLWLDLKKQNRFSVKFKGQNSTPDNIILSKSLFDATGIFYKDNSFKVFKPSYLYKNNSVNRWNKRKFKGYSDHLPIMAIFATKPYAKEQIKNTTNKKATINSIDYLYQIQNVKNYSIDNVVVIYKQNNIAIIKQNSKQRNSRAILIFRPDDKLKVGYIYDIVVNSIETYNGLKEIKELSYIKQKGQYKEYKKLYLDGSKIDLFDEKYQNQIIYNLSGIYKKGYLYFKKSRIKLYYKKGVKRPKDGENIIIRYAHLGIYKSQIQLDFIR